MAQYSIDQLIINSPWRGAVELLGLSPADSVLHRQARKAAGGVRDGDSRGASRLMIRESSGNCRW